MYVYIKMFICLWSKVCFAKFARILIKYINILNMFD